MSYYTRGPNHSTTAKHGRKAGDKGGAYTKLLRPKRSHWDQKKAERILERRMFLHFFSKITCIKTPTNEVLYSYPANRLMIIVCIRGLSSKPPVDCHDAQQRIHTLCNGVICTHIGRVCLRLFTK